MANPNIATLAAAVAAVLAEGQLTNGNTDFTVPTGKAWKPASGTLCNTSGAAVTVTLSMLSAAGGTVRRILSYGLAAGDTLDLSAYLPAFLPEGAILRATASAVSAVDLVITGTALG